MKKTENRGGVRIASPGKKIGRPKKEPTKVISFRVPIKYSELLKTKFKNYLDSFAK